MDVLRTGCSLLGNLEPETSLKQQVDVADRLLSVLPSIICYWYRFSHQGKRINTSVSNPSIGGQFLEMLLGTKPSKLASQAMNVSLILYAEHEFNASTFTAVDAALPTLIVLAAAPVPILTPCLIITFCPIQTS